LCVEAALKAVQRTFPEVYESNSSTATDETGALSGSQVQVTCGDFEFALLHMTPSSRRHVSQYDLVSLQKPQSFLYSRQAAEVRGQIIDCVLKRNLTSDASGKATWQLLEPLTLRISYDGSVHPESMAWRFACGIADGLDGFQVYPVDLTSLTDEGSLDSSIWRGLNDARLKGGAFCVLFKSFEGLALDDRKAFHKILKRFVNSLLPGEPVVMIYTSAAFKRNPQSCFGKRVFELTAPDSTQVQEYFNFLLRSIYRLLGTETASKKLMLCEEAFLSSFILPSQGDKPSVSSIERARMDICDLVSRDPLAFAAKYFHVPVFEEVVLIAEPSEAIATTPNADLSDGLPEDFLFK